MWRIPTVPSPAVFYIALIGGGLLTSAVLALIASVLAARKPADMRTLLRRSFVIAAACTPLFLGSGGHPPLVMMAPAIFAPILCSPLFFHGAIEWLFGVQNAATWLYVLMPFGLLWLITLTMMKWAGRRVHASP